MIFIFFLLLSLLIAFAGIIILPGSLGFYIGVIIVALALLCGLFPKKKSKITIGNFSWTINDFCRGWLITGQTGSGKTACAIKTILHALFRDVPEWGGAVVDQKGQFYEIVQEIADSHNARDKIAVMRIGSGESSRYNLLSYPGISWESYAGIIVDTAECIGVKLESFWKSRSEDLIATLLELIALDKTPTLGDLCDYINNFEQLKKLAADLTMMDTALSEKSQKSLTKLNDFLKISQATRDGVIESCKSFLNFFSAPEIREVFCPDENTVDFRDIDNGKIFVISMPQRYSRERLFFNTFLKLLFSKHATFRFDNPQNYNLIAFVADEAQQVVTSSRHSSDHETVAVIREARATFILAAQSITSFAPKLKKEELEALVLNFANQIYFTVADQAAAEAASRIFGNHKVVEETKSTGRGSNSISRREVDKPVYSTAELRGLKKYQCVIRHPSGKHEKTYLPPLDERGKIPMFYYQDRYDFVAPFFYILQTK